jgi:hypothetical protein
MSSKILQPDRNFAERHEAEVARGENDRLVARFDLAYGRLVSRERRRRMAQLLGAAPATSVSEDDR